MHSIVICSGEPARVMSAAQGSSNQDPRAAVVVYSTASKEAR